MDHRELTLCVMAAGMGSRYGGLKQLDGVGPEGETILEYSVFDALRAGFQRVVFVIRREFDAEFRDKLVGRFGGRVPVAMAFQSLDDLPPGFAVPPGREKPWGTGQAMLCARRELPGPFAILNADDFYGRAAFAAMAEFLKSLPREAQGPVPSAMIGYRLDRTLSEHGQVARGVCRTDSRGNLQKIVELTGIQRTGGGFANAGEGEWPEGLNGAEPVSMNFWGFSEAIFPLWEEYFQGFLRERGGELKSEMYIPAGVDRMIREGRGYCRVLEADSPWFGMTYREDKPRVMESIRAMVRTGEYPQRLWG
jgi:hypothetical protein